MIEKVTQIFKNLNYKTKKYNFPIRTYRSLPLPSCINISLSRICLSLSCISCSWRASWYSLCLISSSICIRSFFALISRSSSSISRRRFWRANSSSETSRAVSSGNPAVENGEYDWFGGKEFWIDWGCSGNCWRYSLTYPCGMLNSDIDGMKFGGAWVKSGGGWLNDGGIGFVVSWDGKDEYDGGGWWVAKLRGAA